MEVTMTNNDLKVLNIIMGKLGTTDDPIACWEISGRVLVLDGKIEQIKRAEEEPVAIKNYRNEKKALMRSLRRYVGEMQDPFGNKIERYEKKDDESDEKLADEMGKLDEKYKQDFDKNDIRREKLIELLEKEVSVDLDPIEYAWCFNMDERGNKRGLISGNEMAFLRKYGLLVKKEDKADKK